MHQLHEGIRVLLKESLKISLYLSILVVLLYCVNTLDELIQGLVFIEFATPLLILLFFDPINQLIDILSVPHGPYYILIEVTLYVLLLLLVQCVLDKQIPAATALWTCYPGWGPTLLFER